MCINESARRVIHVHTVVLSALELSRTKEQLDLRIDIKRLNLPTPSVSLFNAA